MLLWQYWMVPTHLHAQVSGKDLINNHLTLWLSPARVACAGVRQGPDQQPPDLCAVQPHRHVGGAARPSGRAPCAPTATCCSTPRRCPSPRVRALPAAFIKRSLQLAAAILARQIPPSGTWRLAALAGIDRLVQSETGWQGNLLLPDCEVHDIGDMLRHCRRVLRVLSESLRTSVHHLKPYMHAASAGHCALCWPVHGDALALASL